LLPFTPDAELLLTQMRVALDWSFPRGAWLRAGQAHAAYSARRRANGGTLPRRVLTDHLIGAHAVTLGLPLVTLNGKDYSDYPELTVVVP
jgi:predicted nucleic acid-binding protein